MRLSLGQNIAQVQRQVLTPRMIQSMEILQMSHLELEEHIQQELDQNPLLEWDEQPVRSQNWLDSHSEWRDDMFANIPEHEETLQEHLLSQLLWINMDDSLRQMTERIIYKLDRNGHLSMTDSEFMTNQEWFATTATEKDHLCFNTALDLVRSLEPIGVGARNLADCLLLQLHSGLQHEELLRELLTNHLDDLRHNRLPLVARRTAIGIPTIQAALSELHKLNPRPGADFVTYESDGLPPSPPLPIVPDVVAKRNPDGTYTVQLIDDRMTHLKINHHDQNLFQKEKENMQKDDRERFQQKIGSAQWLIDMIRQRKHTLQRVSQAIVNHQTAFLEYGPSSMKPLIMQQIADKVGVHVTTVSRACAGKWIQTPQGTLPLNRFFTGTVASVDDDDKVISQDTAMVKLKEFVEKENRVNPYSDEELAQLMDAAGIKLARRTVAKYRTVLNIPSSRERKIWG